MTLPITAEEITNLYLYGDTVPPSDLADPALAFHVPVAPLVFDRTTFMAAGPGRFELR
jgi:hypothetical protein